MAPKPVFLTALCRSGAVFAPILANPVKSSEPISADANSLNRFSPNRIILLASTSQLDLNSNWISEVLELACERITNVLLFKNVPSGGGLVNGVRGSGHNA